MRRIKLYKRKICSASGFLSGRAKIGLTDMEIGLQCFYHESMLIISYHCGVWTAECETLGLIMKFDSFDELVKRMHEMAPELVEMSNIEITRFRNILKAVTS